MKYFSQSTNRVLCLLFMFICLVSASAYAQGTVTGQVADEDGESLIGVTVRVQGTTTGTVTDYDGVFSLAVPSEAVLEFSYTGYETQVVPVGTQTNFDITLNTIQRY